MTADAITLSGSVTADGVVDGILDSLTVGADELWYVESIEVWGTDGYAGTSTYHTVEARVQNEFGDVYVSDSRTDDLSTGTEGADAFGTPTNVGQYLYPTEAIEVEQTQDGDSTADSTIWYLVKLRRVL